MPQIANDWRLVIAEPKSQELPSQICLEVLVYTVSVHRLLFSARVEKVLQMWYPEFQKAEGVVVALLTFPISLRETEQLEKVFGVKGAQTI